MEAHDLSRLRLTITAGEPLDGPTARAWMTRAGCRIHEAYGQTESLMTVANYPVTEIRPGAMGLPLPGMAVEVLDEESPDPGAGGPGWACGAQDAVRGSDARLLERPRTDGGLFRDQ